MLIVENMAALFAFALCLGGFALGYVLRDWVDVARADWIGTFTHRQRQARKRTAYRRANDGR